MSSRHRTPHSAPPPPPGYYRTPASSGPWHLILGFRGTNPKLANPILQKLSPKKFELLMQEDLITAGFRDLGERLKTMESKESVSERVCKESGREERGERERLNGIVDEKVSAFDCTKKIHFCHPRFEYIIL